MNMPEISFPLFNITLNPPNAFSIGPLTIHWYGVIIAIGFILAVAYSLRRSKQFGLKQDDIIDMLLLAVPLAIVCARLYYVVFTPDQYFGPGKWINIIKIWEGGLAIYGGVIGAVIGVIIICRKKKIPIGAMLDIGGLGLLIGQAIGRWGNFINREAYGAETAVPWKMGLTTAAGTTYHHPTFLYESLWNALGFVLLHFLSKKRKFDGQIFVMYIGWYGFGRFFIEGLRTDSLYIPGTSIRVSQLLAGIMFIAAIVILILCSKKCDPSKLYCNRGAGGDTPGTSQSASDELADRHTDARTDTSQEQCESNTETNTKQEE